MVSMQVRIRMASKLKTQLILPNLQRPAQRSEQYTAGLRPAPGLRGVLSECLYATQE